MWRVRSLTTLIKGGVRTGRRAYGDHGAPPNPRTGGQPFGGSPDAVLRRFCPYGVLVGAGVLNRDQAEEISGYRKVPPWDLGLVLLRLLSMQRENGPP